MWCLVIHRTNGDTGNDRILGEGRAAHEMEQLLALATEARGAVGHFTGALGGANGLAEVGLWIATEFAIATLNSEV